MVTPVREFEGSAGVLLSRALERVNQALAAVEATRAAFRVSPNDAVARQSVRAAIEVAALSDAVDRIVELGTPTWTARVNRIRSIVVTALDSADTAAYCVHNAVQTRRISTSLATQTRTNRSWISEWGRRLTIDAEFLHADRAVLALDTTRQALINVRALTEDLALRIPAPVFSGSAIAILRGASLVLPPSARRRWVEDWYGEMATLTWLRRLRFAGQMLCGIPRLALTLRGWNL